MTRNGLHSRAYSWDGNQRPVFLSKVRPGLSCQPNSPCPGRPPTRTVRLYGLSYSGPLMERGLRLRDLDAARYSGPAIDRKCKRPQRGV